MRIAAAIYLQSDNSNAKYRAEEYWIVDPENRSVLIFRLEEHDLKQVASVKDDDLISSPLLSGLKLSVPAIFNL